METRLSNPWLPEHLGRLLLSKGKQVLVAVRRNRPYELWDTPSSLKTAEASNCEGAIPKFHVGYIF